MTEPTIESLQAEITRLKAHADDLLSERRAEKARREAAESALQTAQEAAQAANVKLDDVVLTAPVLRALESVTAAPPAQGRKLLEDAGIKFLIGKQGTAVAIDGEAEIPLPDLHRHLLKRCDTPEGLAAFGWILRASGTTGGGARGGSSSSPAPSSKAPNDIKPAIQLGLR